MIILNYLQGVIIRISETLRQSCDDCDIVSKMKAGNEMDNTKQTLVVCFFVFYEIQTKACSMLATVVCTCCVQCISWALILIRLYAR